MSIDRKDIGKELESLARQRDETERQRAAAQKAADEAAAMIHQIDGAIRLGRHLYDKDSAREILARQEAEAAGAGAEKAGGAA